MTTNGDQHTIRLIILMFFLEDGLKVVLSVLNLNMRPVFTESMIQLKLNGTYFSDFFLSMKLQYLMFICILSQALDPVESGPYTQLTHEELITLVVKQQTDLSRKDATIVELEEYIDNLLVRVIEEKPTILQSLKAYK